MDDSYPLFTYFDPTVNMLAKLEGLAKETGQPLRQYMTGHLQDTKE